MVLLREFSVSCLDLILWGILRHSQDLVVAFLCANQGGADRQKKEKTDESSDHPHFNHEVNYSSNRSCLAVKLAASAKKLINSDYLTACSR